MMMQGERLLIYNEYAVIMAVSDFATVYFNDNDSADTHKQGFQ